VTTTAYLSLGAFVFTMGVLGTVLRPTAAGRLVGVELMLAAATLTFASSAAGFRELDGQLAALLVVVAAAAHAIIGAALIASLRRPP